MYFEMYFREEKWLKKNREKLFFSDINGDTIADSTLSAVYRVNAGEYRPGSIWGYGCSSAYQPVYLAESGDFDGDG